MIGGAPARLDRLRIGLLGLCGALSQTLLLREFLATFAGNEAVIAAFLGPWLLWGALGALAGRGPRAAARATAVLWLLGPASAATLAAIRMLPALFPAGSWPGLGAALLWGNLLLAPCCALGGYCFSALSGGGEEGGGAYLAEALGAALAGALCAALVPRLLPFQAAGAMVLASGAAAALGARPARAGLALTTSALGAALLVALPVGRWALARQGAHLRDASEIPSALGSLVVARQDGQTTIYANRRPVLSGADPAAAEEIADLPLAFHRSPKAVALLGAAPEGTLAEILAHAPERVDWLVEDRALLELLAADDPASADPRVHPAARDIRRALRARPATYDAVLLVAPEPMSAQENRLFTAELFEAARVALRPGGLFALWLPGQNEYAAPEKRALDSSVRRTMEQVFGEIRLLPLERTLYLARPGAPLPPELAAPEAVTAALAACGLSPRHLGRGLLDDQLSPRRIEDARRWSSLAEPVNHDLAPTSYRLALDRFLVELGEGGASALALLALTLLASGLLLFGPRGRPVELAVLTSGAAGLSTELLLMLWYQTATGALCRELGLFLAGFMGGAALGALGARWLRELPALRLVFASDLAQAALAIAFALALPAAMSLPAWAVRPAAFAAAALAGALPGAQFAAATRSVGAGQLWAADLLGAAAAALVTLTLLVPWLGMAGTLAAVAALKASSAALLAAPRPAAEQRETRPAPVAPLALAGFVALAVGESSHASLYAFTLQTPYLALALALLLLGALGSFEPARLRGLRVELSRRLAGARLRLGAPAGQLVRSAVLLPVGGFPIARCYFDVPYLLCHVCPRQCVFGLLRPYLVPAALLANLHERRFCERLCPLGTVQAGCERLRAPRARLLGTAGRLRLGALALVAAAYFVARGERPEGVQGVGLYQILFRNSYAPVLGTLAVAFGLLIGSLFVRRPFCNGLCPIGAASDLIARAERGSLTLLSRRPTLADPPRESAP